MGLLPYRGSGKSVRTAYLLLIFLGTLGAHYFYIGSIRSAQVRLILTAVSVILLVIGIMFYSWGPSGDYSYEGIEFTVGGFIGTAFFITPAVLLFIAQGVWWILELLIFYDIVNKLNRGV